MFEFIFIIFCLFFPPKRKLFLFALSIITIIKLIEFHMVDSIFLASICTHMDYA